MRQNTPFSIKHTVFLLFFVVMVLTLAGIGTVVYARWAASAERSAHAMADQIGSSLQTQLTSFMDIPWTSTNIHHAIIEEGIVDIDNDAERDRFFATIISSLPPSLYSLGYGTKEGRYYGARRNGRGEVEIMRNDEHTGSHSLYYSIDTDSQAAEMVLDAGPFDPRTRDWYKVAEQTGNASFSAVYKHFVIEDLTISAAWPIYENNTFTGVLATHVLLTQIGNHLAKTMQASRGQALVVERKTGLVVANSLGMKNFITAADGSLQRLPLSNVPNRAFLRAYETGQSAQVRGYQVSMLPLVLPGVDWLVLCAVPTDLLYAEVRNTIIITIFWALLALFIGLLLYNTLAGYLMRPLSELFDVSQALSKGDLSRRVTSLPKNEIGGIALGMNNVADTMQNLINTLEVQVQDRTEALHESNQQLELLLNSTAEGIYGMDIQGNCTFCNQSAVSILGYESDQLLIGKPMHNLIHHSKRTKEPLAASECKIFRAIREGIGYAAEDEVFWKADGTWFEVSYHAYPQIRNGKVVGGVVSFMDITARKQREDQIAYLGSHDSLTGLFNRRYFEEQFFLLDRAEHLPLSLIFADLNGLKLTNDIFGHKEGDSLLCQTADILKQSCRGGDVVARIGGDEFILLLPNTDHDQACEVITQIRRCIAAAPFETIQCSISLGCETKTDRAMLLSELMANAENSMYEDKISNRKQVQQGMLGNLQDRLFCRSPVEKEHALTVRKLSRHLGSALHLSEAEIATLEQAALLHDIGKISLSDELLGKHTLSDHEYAAMQQHAVIGYRILNLFEDTLTLAEVVYSHHERWDGSGYPRGLSGNQIPLLARIIAIAEVYGRVLMDAEGGMQQKILKARTVIAEGAGTQFDAELATLFLRIESQQQYF